MHKLPAELPRYEHQRSKGFSCPGGCRTSNLDNVSLSELEKRMMYFTESDPTSCEDPFGLNEEFEAQYDAPEYESKISGLLHHAHKRLKGENPEKVREWNDAMRTLSRGDHYLLVLWRVRPASKDGKGDSGRNVITCGIIALIVCYALGVLSQNPNIPSWVVGSLGVLLLFLCFLTLFFLAQQGYRALRRRKSG
jgi:hypothetical protein